MQKLIIAITAALCLVSTVNGQQKPGSASAAKLARGKYLVVDIGLCGDCHTPHNDKGEPVKEQTLKGATLDFKPVAPVPVWADKAPAIAGLPGWEDGAAIKFLMTGVAYNGLPRRPPMPQYRFNVQDAQAIVAYLKSLAPGK
ncbi:MAG TPA: c-type cytochrome [Candidatus Sulfotelmatobacter sp.]|nr:c-type cytochrome [Candidatus Sulfotelmatobacter sp.]